MKPYFEETIKDTKPTLVVFLHAANQDAVDAKYKIEQLEKEFDGRANFRRVDVSYNHHLNHKFRLNQYPAWVLYKEGEELMRETGDKTLTQLSELVERGFN